MRYFLSLIVCKIIIIIIIMTEILTLEKIIAFLKVDLTFACCWPLPMKVTKSQKICDKIFRLICCLNGILMSISLIYTLIYKCDSTILIMKVGCELSAFLQIPIQITLFTLQKDRLQVRDIYFYDEFIIISIYLYHKYQSISRYIKYKFRKTIFK